MDKLLLSLSLALLLMTLTVNSALISDSKIVSSIDHRQKNQPSELKLKNIDDDSIKGNETTPNASDDDDNSDHRRERMFDRRLGETVLRQNKMIGFNPFNTLPFGHPSYSAPLLYPAQFYDDFDAFFRGYGSDKDEPMSRHNTGYRRRQPNYKNSPIFYIRLPPTPYMFVPGLGYISQPPSYTPMTPVPQPISPFYSLPLDFISNGKPTNIYQWGSPANQFIQQPQFVQSSHQFVSPYQRPYTSQRPINPFAQESKLTKYKEQFVFNGRPEDIFSLPNVYNSFHSDSKFSNGFY